MTSRPNSAGLSKSTGAVEAAPGAHDTSPDALAGRIRVVLVGTQHPGNIGSAARAMKTMGLSRLHLVAPEKFPHAEAEALAAGADDLLANAVVHATVPEALAGCRWVIGTSARRRSIGLPAYWPRQAAQAMAEQAREGEVALLFGPERTGLENEDLQRCHATVGIPSNPGYSSLNLAAAVQVLSYELRLALFEAEAVAPSLPTPDVEPASADAMERFFEHLLETLDDIDFHKGRTPDKVMQRLRRLFLRATPDERELRILRGIFADAQRMARLAGQAKHGTDAS